MMGSEKFRAIVAEAMLAPSAHNTQPVRWSQDDAAMTLSADLSRRLPVGDPDDRDLMIACGAAIESTILAMARHGFSATVLLIEDEAVTQEKQPYRPFARILPNGTPTATDMELAAFQQARVTHRGGFAPSTQAALSEWDHPHLTLVQSSEDIAWLARQVDKASARLLLERALRKELLTWMRLNSRHPRYQTDGLNRETLFLDRFTARMVGPILRTRAFDALSAFGLGPTLSGEYARSNTASAVALFHWPSDGSLIDAGRAFYRMWLEATSRGMAGWPAAALADDPKTSAQVSKRFKLPKNRRLINALRLGHVNGATPSRTRLSVSEVIV